jgi:hypothetical protein
VLSATFRSLVLAAGLPVFPALVLTGSHLVLFAHDYSDIEECQC